MSSKFIVVFFKEIIKPATMMLIRRDAEILAFQTNELYENITCKQRNNESIAITRNCTNYTCTCNSLTPGTLHSIELTNSTPTYSQIFYLNNLGLVDEYLTSEMISNTLFIYL